MAGKVLQEESTSGGSHESFLPPPATPPCVDRETPESTFSI